MKVTIIESPYDSGFREQRMGAGPTHLLEAGLVGGLAADGHDVELVRLDLGPGIHPEIGAGLELMRRVSRAVAEAVEGKRFPVVLSGNCGAAVGAVSGIGSPGTGVLWFDAHGDLNTPETTESGFFDGMGYAMLLGHGWRSLAATVPGFSPVPGGNAALVGARDLDPPEAEHLEAWGVESFSPSGIRSQEGGRAIERWAGKAPRVYVHVDLDVLDPSVLEANWLATADGLTLAELQATIGAARRGASLAGIGFASYDPAVDTRNAGSSVVRETLGRLLADLESGRRVGG